MEETTAKKHAITQKLKLIVPIILITIVLCLYKLGLSRDNIKDNVILPVFASYNSSRLKLYQVEKKLCKPEYGPCKPRIWNASTQSCSLQQNYTNMSGDTKLTKGENHPRCQCTWDIIREHIKRCDSLPYMGNWQFEGGSSTPKSFLPQLCTIPESSPSVTQQCLQRLQVKKIVTLGDSNAARYFLAVVRMFNATYNGTCTYTRLEHEGKPTNFPNHKYFIYGTPLNESMLCSRKRQCRTCWSRTVMCNSRGQGTLIIEHLAMNFLRDTTLRLCKPPQDMLATDTAQEYYFRHYLSGNPPQIVIIIPPFAHERQAIKGITDDFFHLYKVVKEFYARKSRVIWLPYSTKWTGVGEHEVMEAKIYKSNEMMFQHIKNDILVEGSTQYTHFDLNAISCPLRKWKEERAHFSSFWYDDVINKSFNLICQ